MCDVKALLRYPLPFSFVGSNTLLSQASSTLNPQLSSPGIPWLSGLTNILESPIPSKLYLHSFTQWPLWASIQTHPWHVPGLNSFPQLRRKIPQPLPCVLDAKSRTMWPKLPRFCAWYSGRLTPSHKYIFNFLSRFPLKNPLDLMDFPFFFFFFYKGLGFSLEAFNILSLLCMFTVLTVICCGDVLFFLSVLCSVSTYRSVSGCVFP